MIGTRRAGIVAADRCNRSTVGKINRPALHFGFALQLGVVLDNAFHGLEHPGKGFLEVIGEHKHFIRCFLCESPRQGQSTEGKGESQHFALMVTEPEGLAELVFLDELVCRRSCRRARAASKNQARPHAQR